MKTQKVGESEFVRTKWSALDGKTTVTYAEPHGFKLEAKPYGLVITGSFEIVSEEALNEFAKLMSDAWQDRRALKPKLSGSLSGH